MACRMIHTWTFCSLVGAFLDLGLAYLVLCGSTIAFFAAKFLGLFGLSLPCPCNGLFGDPDSGNGCRCMQGMLVEYPARRISSVQMLAQSRFPFDRIFVKGDCTSNVKLLEDGGIHGRLLETGSGDSRSHMVESICSYAEGQGMNNLVMNEAHSSSEMDGGNSAVQCRNGRKLEEKGKALWIPKPRPSLRRRRKYGAEHGRTSNAALATHLRLVGQRNSGCNSEQGQETSDESFSCSCSRGSVQHCVERSYGEGHVERTLSGSESNGIFGEHKIMVGGPHEKRRFGESETIDVQALERALKKEHAARSTLYLELEEERNAAATAADEAMAMISRLQEEKAAIEMEARQYRRMIEEKAAYDAEEMNILKEILLRREREKLVLEKEVEVYREMLFTGKSEQSEEDSRSALEATIEKGHGLSFDLNDDPEILLQQISASLVKRKGFKVASSSNAHLGSLLEAENNFKDSPVFANEDSAKDKDTAKHLDVYGSSDQASSSKQTDLHGFESSDKHSDSVDGSTERFDVQFDEKTMLSIGDPTNSQAWPSKLQDAAKSRKSCCHPAQGLHDNTSSLHAEFKMKGNKEGNGIYNATSERGHCPCVSRKEHDILLYDPDQLGDHIDVANNNTSDDKGSAFDPESGVYDVHVVNDNIQISKIDSGQESEGLSSRTKYSSMGRNDHSVVAPRITNGDASSDPSSSDKNEGRSDLIRSGSEMNTGAHTWDGQALSVGLRRHSISVVEGEKLRLNNEVEQLIEKLRTVQKSRDKLNLSLEHRDKEKTHLRLLEEIAQQLRDIRELTEPGKSVRQASLPPLSSKASSKKRRCRSVSWGLNEST